MYGDRKAGLEALTCEEAEVSPSLSWLPADLPTPPTLPMSSWINAVDEVRLQTRIIVDHFNIGKQNLGTADPPTFWVKKAEVRRLTHGKQILMKANYRDSRVAPQDLVSWSSLLHCTISKGPA